MSHTNENGDDMDRWVVLACDATTGDVALRDSDEALAAREAHGAEFEQFELVAAALAVGLTPAEELPNACRAKLLAQLSSDEIAAPALKIANAPAPAVRSGGVSVWKFAAVAGWAMAAVLAMVVAVTLIVQAQSPVSPEAARQGLLAQGATPVSWTAWDNPAPMYQQVSGDVVWDDERQEGYMRFVGLPANDASKSQYQLWILDGRYENPLEQRVSGGVFDVNSAGEVIVPIREGMSIDDAIGFAITVERPGGVWVSDMADRVVIALKG